MNPVRGSRPFVDVVTQLLSRGYQVRFRAEGGSMRPAIRGGETITVGPACEIGMGDIALYRTERGVIAHRVVGIRKENGESPLFLTRGDARGSTEEAVRAQQILGKVVAIERNGRSIEPGGRWARIRYGASNVARFARAALFLLALAGAAVFPEEQMSK